MNRIIEMRVLEEAEKFLSSASETIRGLARKINVSKSTLHHDLTAKLIMINYTLYLEVRSKLLYNLSVRHIHGGIAKAKKYNNLELNETLNVDI